MEWDEFLHALKSVNRHGAALHKPLMLLLALGRVRSGAPRLVLYRELADAFCARAKSFHRSPHAHYPFWRLRGDGLWEVENAQSFAQTSKGDALHAELRDRHARGGFTQPVYELLCANPLLVEIASELLLSWYFPEHLREALRAFFVPSARPSFDAAVLRAYDGHCAICDSALRTTPEPPWTPRATHIQWRVAGGPDEVRNGLALCDGHRSAFHWGAIGLQPKGDDFRVLLSSQLGGLGPLSKLLEDFKGKVLRSPDAAQHAPARSYIAWHQEHVFRA